MAKKSFEFKPANWVVNKASINKQIRDYFVDAMKKSETKLADLLKEEIQSIDHASTGGHGAPEWEDDIVSRIRTVYRDVAQNYIESGVGISPNSPEWLRIEAEVYESGVGSKADPIQPTIVTKPGEDTWQSTSSSNPRIRLDESGASQRYLIPQFNQSPTYFIENAMKRMQKFFNDILDEACETLPDSIFYTNIKSTVR